MGLLSSLAHIRLFPVYNGVVHLMEILQACLLSVCIITVSTACSDRFGIKEEKDASQDAAEDLAQVNDGDGDTITDEDEGDGDQDGDTIPNDQDTDSDGDSMLDSTEAGDDDPRTPPADTDGDGLADFLDSDSDGDGLSDQWEHANGLSPRDMDTDDDGALDVVEVATATDPRNPSSSPDIDADFCFVIPYGTGPAPQEATFAITLHAPASIASLQPRDDDSDLLDATVFIEDLIPLPEGGVIYMGDHGAECTPGITWLETDGDTLPDIFTSVPDDSTICFKMDVAVNNTAASGPTFRIFHAYLDLDLDGIITEDVKRICFVVPP